MVSVPIGAVVAEHEPAAVVGVVMVSVAAQSPLAGVRKFTAPVGVGPVEVTVAEYVTEVPDGAFEGVADATVVVLARTVRLTAFEVELPKFVSPG
jgi:hypothetical protein